MEPSRVDAKMYPEELPVVLSAAQTSSQQLVFKDDMSRMNLHVPPKHMELDPIQQSLGSPQDLINATRHNNTGT